MRLRDVEMMLSRVPPHPKPRADLEQYATPADVAAPLLFEAANLGDIEGKRVLDLGCGTGILGLGAAILGAREVVGVEVDPEAVAVAREQWHHLKVPSELHVMDVRMWSGSADMVVMNPPFGAQIPGADRVFLDAAFRSAPVVYSMHNANTRAFVEGYAAERGFEATHAWAMRMTLRHQYAHQTRASVDVDVIAIRFLKLR